MSCGHNAFNWQYCDLIGRTSSVTVAQILDSRQTRPFFRGAYKRLNRVGGARLFIDSDGSNALHNIITLWYLYYLSNITKYAIKTGNITQVTLLTNVTRYLSNIVTVTSLILRNIITTSNEVTNLVSYPLSNA